MLTHSLALVNCGASIFTNQRDPGKFEAAAHSAEGGHCWECIHVHSSLAQLIGDERALTSHAKLLSLGLFSCFSVTEKTSARLAEQQMENALPEKSHTEATSEAEPPRPCLPGLSSL